MTTNSRIRPCKNHKFQSQYKRSLHMEALEERALLSASPLTAAEYDALTAQYAEFNLPDRMADLNVITLDLAEGDGLTQLKNAITAARQTSQSDLIVVRTSDTANTLTYSANTDELVIDMDSDQYGSVTIVGWGTENLTLDANQMCRVMNVGGETTVANLGGLTFTHGQTTGQAYINGGAGVQNFGTLMVANCTFSENRSSVSGGGIRNAGTLAVLNSTFSENSASRCGGGIGNADTGTVTVQNSTFLANSSSEGGGIYNYNLLTVTNSTISDNIASGYGGGIWNYSGPVTVTNSTISGNTSYCGGGIFSNGTFTVTNSTISGNTASSQGGGGIYSNGTFTVTNSTISGNTASSQGGGGIWNNSNSKITITNSTISGNTASSNYGGGIYNSPNGTITVTNSTISGNTASSNYGGGIYNSPNGTLTVTNSKISGNYSYNHGGGIYSSGTLTVTSSTISENNSSHDGGGISSSGTLTVTNSTISGNASAFNGGGICNYGTLTVTNSTISGNSSLLIGGGIYTSGTLTVTNSTISGNTASSQGGGIYNSSGTFTVTNSTISGNTSSSQGGGGIFSNGTFTVTNSTISGNSASTGGGIYSNTGIITVINSIVSQNYATQNAQNIWGTLSDESHNNLIGYYAGFENAPVFDTEGNLINRDSLNLHLRSDSRAIDAGDNSAISENAVDLDGNVRIYGNTVDIGAYEYKPFCYSAVVTTLEDSFNLYDGKWSLREAIYYASEYVTITFADNLNGTITLTQGQLLVDKALAIDGGGRIAIDADQKSRVMCVEAGTVDTPVVLSGLTIQNGQFTGHGAGIYIDNPAVLTVSDCTISGNTGVSSTSYGGGIYNKGILSIVNTTISGNSVAGHDGAGIFNTNKLTITNSEISGNTTAFSGGGIYNSGTLTINNSLIAGNRTTASTYGGGGIYNRNGSITITNSTISGNATSNSGGGIANISGTLTVLNSIVSQNYAHNSYQNISGTLSSSSHNNVIGEYYQAGFVCPPVFDSEGTLVNADELDLHLRSDSQAIDAGDSSIVSEIAKDIEGNARVYGESVDIGVYEYQGDRNDEPIAYSTVVNTLNDSFDLEDDEWSLREAVYYAPEYVTITFAENLSGTITLTRGQIVVDKTLAIDGDGRIVIDADQKSRVMIVDAGTSENPVVLRGLTITNGLVAEFGGGIYNNGHTAIIDCSISGNTTNRDGGGVYNAGNLTLQNCRIFENTAVTRPYGGGIYNHSTGNLFIVNCVVSRNVAAHGGGLENYQGTVTITNSTFVGNTAEVGGGIYDMSNGKLTVNNTIIAGNTGTDSDDDIYANSNSIKGENNLSTFTNWSSGSNNFFYAPNLPLFVDAANGDYRLVEGSQAIDKGNNSQAVDTNGENLVYDMAGNARIVNDTVDLGAYEYQERSLLTPTSLRCINNTTTSASLSWDSVDNASGYTVIYSTSPDFSNSVTLSGIETNSVTVNDLSGNIYYFRVMANGTDSYSNSPYSESITVLSEYSFTEIASLQAFLEHADSNGNKNGKRINSNYNVNDPTTWSGITWTTIDGMKRATVINWVSKGLTGFLNLDGCDQLLDVNMEGNRISGINVRGCTELTALRVHYLSELDVSQNLKLTTLACRWCSFSELDVSNNVLLEKLWCPENTLTELDLSQNVNLLTLFCMRNQFTALDLSNNARLKNLYCFEPNASPLKTVLLNENVSNLMIGSYWGGTWNFTDREGNLLGSGSSYTTSTFPMIAENPTNGEIISFATSFLDTPSLNISVTDDNAVAVSWDAIENAASYQFEYKLSTDANWTKQNTTSTSATFVGIPGKKYNIRVKAMGSGNGADSGYSTASLNLDPQINYEELREQYSDFNLPESVNDLNVITVDLTAGDDLAILKAAITEAGQTTQSDLIIIRTSAEANTLTYTDSSDELNFNINSSQYGSVTIVNVGEEDFILDADQICRVMTVSGNPTIVNLGGLTITNGNAGNSYGGGIYNNYATLTISNCTIEGNTGTGSSSYGGGIYNNGVLSIANTTISGNTASGHDGGGVFNSNQLTITNCEISGNTTAFAGGGIFNSGKLTVDNSIITGNSSTASTYGGGGIYSRNGSVTITDSTISENTSSYDGGGICNYTNSVLFVSNCIISDNQSASFGGGILNYQAKATIENSIITNNSSLNWGGAIRTCFAQLSMTNCTITDNTATSEGGGIHERGGTSVITNCLIAGNTSNRGGGILNTGKMTLTNSTISGNSATENGSGIFNGYYTNDYVCTLDLHNTIIANNENSDIYINKNYGTIEGFNNLSTYTEWDSGSDNLVYDPAKPLFVDAENGDYHLIANSQALDKGSNTFAIDVNGQALLSDLDNGQRIINGTVDVGAYEYQTEPLAAPVLNQPVVDGSTISFSWEAVTNASAYLFEYKAVGTDSWTSEVIEGTRVSFEGMPNREYVARVKALGASDYTDSVYSAEQYVKIDVKITINANKVTVSWVDESPAADAVRYRVAGTAKWTLKKLNAGVTEFSFNAAVGTNYEIEVLLDQQETNILEGTAVVLDQPKLAAVKNEIKDDTFQVSVTNYTTKNLAANVTQAILTVNDVETVVEITNQQGESVLASGGKVAFNNGLFTFTEMASNMTYKVLVSFSDGRSVSKASSAVSVKTLKASYLAPEIISATATSDSSITVTWETAKGKNSDTAAQKYTVQYSLDGVKWTNATTAATGNTFTIQKLKGDCVYHVRVQATKDTLFEASAPSEVLTAETLALPKTVLEKTSVKDDAFQINVTNYQISNLTKATAVNVKSDQFGTAVVELQNGSGSAAFANEMTVTFNRGVLTFAKVPSNTQQKIQISFTLDACTTALAPALTVKTIMAAYNKPTLTNAFAASSTSITVEWETVYGKNTTIEAQAYTVQYSTDGVRWTNATTTATGTSFTIQKLKPNTKYLVAVLATKDQRFNASEPSGSRLVTTLV